MQSKWFGKIGLSALVLGVALSGTVSGCASERDPIDRVQPAVVDKGFFLGESLSDFKDDPEFRTKSYNIDSAANTDSYAGTIGGSSAVDRVRWEVTQDWLFARRSYQESPGADQRGLPRKQVCDADHSNCHMEFPSKPDGTIIAAFKIQKHFDIRRDYNSSTGEQTNVVVENDTDRPWQERQYMRVDWSMNQAESTSGDTSWVFGEGTSATAVQYSATNETDEDRPIFENDKGYFDVTDKYQLKSEVMPQWGISECVILGFFNGGSSFDCTPTEVKVRHSFVKLTGEEDFEPMEESMAPLDIVGNWVNSANNFNREYGPAPITSWDPQYGYTDQNTKTFYAMHEIWMKSHQSSAAALCSDNTDGDKDGTADACANETTGYTGNTGSQCDIYVGKCTIPARDREVKTMGYWLNVEAPVELQDQMTSDGSAIAPGGGGPIEESTVTWNQLLRSAVATRREVECRRTHTDTRENCHALYFEGSGPESKEMVAFGGWGIDKVLDQPVDQGKPIITTCHNPVRQYDQKMCGEVGTVSRLGDVRKNYAIYWPYASRAPYGGVATIGADPLTGEMLGVTATIMMRSATYAAAQQRDIIQVALGDIKLDDIITGVPETKYADLVKNGKVAATSMGRSNEEIAARVTNAKIARANVAATIGEPAAASTLTGVARQIRNAQLKMFSSPHTETMVKADDEVKALLSNLSNSPLRANIANRGLRKILAESANKSSEVFNAISQFADSDPTRVQDLFDQYSAYLGSKGICFQDSMAAAGAGSIYQAALAPYFKKLYGSLDPHERGAKIYADLLRESTKGIAFHEIGHSLGMRHNFASSWDSMNYTPQYWQLRTNEGQSTQPCAASRTGGPDTCMGPRYLDPATDDEQGIGAESRPGIEYFGNTSTMEYQIERFGETVGAGTYDLHFMETIYGRTLETFDAKQVKPEDQQYFALLTLSQGIPDDLVFDPAKGYGMHYTRVATTAKVFDPSRDCRPATEEEKAVAKWRIVHGKVCSPSPKNHLAYEDMKSSEIAFKIGKVTTPIGVDGVRWSGVDETGKTLVRWEFRYGEDYSRGGYIHAKMFDSGADIYETTLNVAKRFDLTYPWAYFRRQNKEFAWWSLPTSIANNTLSRIRGYHWNTTTDIGRADAAALADDDQARPSVMASAEMFKFLQRVILTPEPGTYGIPGANDFNAVNRTPPRPGAMPIYDIADAPTIAVANVGIVDGRFVQIDFDNARGGSWDYQQFPKHVGFDEERVLAMRELVDSRPTLSTVSRENALDGRDPYISFRTDTPAAIDRLVGGLLSEDWETIAPMAVGADQALTGFDILDPDATKLIRPTGSAVLFPNVGYQNEVGASIYAMLFSRFSSDLTLANKMRVRFENDIGPVIPDAKKIAFTDPSTGFRYIATRFGTEKILTRDVEKGIGSRVLQHANDLLAATYKVDTAVPVNAFGEPTLLLDVNGDPIPAATKPEDIAAAKQALVRYVGLIDGLRQVGNIFGGGPLGGGGDD